MSEDQQEYVPHSVEEWVRLEQEVEQYQAENAELRRSLNAQKIEADKMAKYAIGKEEQVRKLIESLSALTSILNND